MQAKGTIPNDKRSATRDKEAKIDSIVNAMLELLATTGYEKVTIRDLAESAGVSLGLIYKYFPGGKPDIMKIIFLGYMGELWEIKQPETVDFSDFPGYMRAVVDNMLQYWTGNRPLIKAMIAAILLDGEIAGDLKKIEAGDYRTVVEFFGRFEGVDIADKNAPQLLADWSITVHGILLNNLLFRKQLMSDEALKNLMVSLSLKIWGYSEQ